MTKKQVRLPCSIEQYNDFKSMVNSTPISREKYDRENPLIPEYPQCHIPYDSILQQHEYIKKTVKEYDEIIANRKAKSSNISNQLRIKRRIDLMMMFNSECKICKESFDSKLQKSNLQFHHVLYDGVRDNFIAEKDLPQYKNILNEVKEYPERFELLCSICHILRGFAKQNYDKMVLVVSYINNTNQ